MVGLGLLALTLLVGVLVVGAIRFVTAARWQHRRLLAMRAARY
jgi:hypothetical protein